MPAPWLRIPLLAGHLLQLAALALGFAAIGQAARLGAAGALLTVVGWLLVYFACHAIAHWAVGRLLGIRFRFYTLAGSEKPESMPPGMRGLFAHLPFLGVRTERDTLLRAAPWRQAAMWSAGATSSVVLPVAAALWAWRFAAPGGPLLLFFTLFWSVGTVAANFRTRGDYWKARQALRA